ncbi:MAG: hypothetical protein V4556_06850 [Bacteroidota bacterium]
MERKLFSDNFERMLREKADEFKMYPSARVWHSIYNNIHPGRRWPSMTMSVVLVALLLLVGYTNTETTIAKKNTLIENNIAPAEKNAIPFIASAINESEKQIAFNSIDKKVEESANEKTALINSTNKNENFSLSSTELISTTPTDNKGFHSDKKSTDVILIAEKNEQLVDVIKVKGASQNQENKVSDNTVAPRKAPGKFGLQIYASPSMISPSFETNGITTLNDAGKSIGLEVGAAMQYALFKKIKVTTGLQLNYISYSTVGHQSTEPTTNTLIKQTQINPMENSGFTNTTGLSPVNFRSETYQVSLPVGVELKLLGKEELHWDIGATIQPTYVMGSNAYPSISSKLNSTSSALNNWNLNAGVETFITYKINGLTWQLGPQLRYQLMSTYGKNASFNENLANYGVKLGVSKALP